MKEEAGRADGEVSLRPSPPLCPSIGGWLRRWWRERAAAEASRWARLSGGPASAQTRAAGEQDGASEARRGDKDLRRAKSRGAAAESFESRVN
ncbi:hypothetical protein NDU88_008132 [Pleurodeles waltl]|uniref:Uncharacterized protein n=1 Tax=Pleurodeles waltl TaxID=8319 RepID=A0AAV7PR85_PLEWA|nr:hypothetical protein NDU88_008132 [Pleurodeles waltl]